MKNVHVFKAAQARRAYFFTHKSGIRCLTKGSHELWYMYISGGYQGGTAGQVYQAPPGYMPAGSAAGQQHPSYMQPGSTVVVQPQPSVVIVGGCPRMQSKILETICFSFLKSRRFYYQT